MTVTVARWPALCEAGSFATSGEGKGESFVQPAPGGGVPEVSRDGRRTIPQQDDNVELRVNVHDAGYDPPVDGRPRGPAPGRTEALKASDTAGLDTSTLDADTGVAHLYQTHWTPMVRLATLLTRDASVAEEIVQDSFVALHQRWRGLSDRGAARAYLRTSVINRARSALRHRGVEERYRQPGAPAPAGPEERAVQADSDARVMAALRTLSRRQQEVLVLRYYGDYSEQDIATTLGLSRGAVKSHAHRGLAALRAALGAAGDAPDGRVS
jgi:RNA polymerase sigma-70 factor (sigma-E family)